MPSKPKILTPAQVALLIKRRNKRFRKANKAGKRVLIAQDVIDSIKAKIFEPITGHFLYTAEILGGEAIRHEGLRERALSGQLSECTACAIGGMMLACTMFTNKVECGKAEAVFGRVHERIESGRPIVNGLNKVFSNEQLKLIECAFEEGDGVFKHDNIPDAYYGNTYRAVGDIGVRAAKFGSRYSTDKGRMVAIMRNIIRNKGTFIP